MRYQILEQAESGEPWTFYAHGSRYFSKEEAASAIAHIEARGARAKLIDCGRSYKGKRRPARLIVEGSRSSYWVKADGFYIADSRMAEADAIAARVGGYPRLDSIMKLKGERPDFIAAHCDERGRFKESGS